MAAPVYTASDFAKGIFNLFPTGRAWPSDPDSTFQAVIAGLAPTYARIQNSDNILISEAMPGLAVQLLPQWEATLGLPDPCAGEAPTLALRQAQALARFINSGGQSIPFFISYAAALGYDIEIGVYGPWRWGDPWGLPWYGSSWSFHWTVFAPVAAGTNDVLSCEFERLKPAHTTVDFVYDL